MSAAFIAAAALRGLVIHRAIADGEIKRVPVEGRAKSERPGWYALHAPSGARMVGVFGRWDDGGKAEKWCEGSDSKPRTKIKGIG